MSNTEIWDAMFFLTTAYLFLMPIAIFFAHRFDNGAGKRFLATALSSATIFTLSYTLSAAYISQVASSLPAGMWFSIIAGFMALFAGIVFPIMAYRNKNGIPYEIPANFTASAENVTKIETTAIIHPAKVEYSSNKGYRTESVSCAFSVTTT